MRTIVGVVRDVRERGYYPEAKPAVYLANTQVGSGTAFVPETLIVRASGDLMSLVAPIRTIVASVDPEQPLSNVRTMDETATRWLCICSAFRGCHYPVQAELRALDDPRGC